MLLSFAMRLWGGGDCDLVAFNLAREQKGQFQTQRLFEYSKNLEFKDFTKELIFKELCCWNVANKAFKKEILIKALKDYTKENLNLTMAEDALIFFKYCQFINKINILDKSLYFYRANENSTTSQQNIQAIKQNLKDESLAINKLENILSKNTNKDYKLFLATNLCLLKGYHLERLQILYKNQKKSKLHFKYILYKVLKKIYKAKRYFLLLLYKFNTLNN